MPNTPELGSFQSKTITVLLGMVALVAGVATTGSLFFSLGLGLVPCHLCWYQRILMYPLVALFAGAAWQREWKMVLYTFPLVTLGWAIALWHSYIQRVGSAGCSPSGGCSAIVYTVGPFSIPNLSLIAFTIILLVSSLLLLNAWKSEELSFSPTP